MKLKTLGLITVTAVLGTLLSPLGFSQEADESALQLPVALDTFPRRPAFAPGPHRPPVPVQRRRSHPEWLIARHDVNEDGMISTEEFLETRLDDVDRVFDRLDRDNDGRINTEEAERPRPHRRLPPVVDREEVYQCVRETIAEFDPPSIEDRFLNVDTDGDGFIDLVELSTALEERAHVLFERLDTNGDGYISLEEVEAIIGHDINLRRVINACIKEIITGSED